MPSTIYEVELPNGQILEIEAPEGTPVETIKGRAKQYQFEQKRAEIAKNQGPDLDPTEGMSTFEKVAAGFGKSIYDTGRGLGQLVGAVSQEDVDRARELDAPLMNTKAGLGGNIAGQAAQIAIPIPAGAAIKATSWAGKAAPLVGAAARGGAFGASQGVGTGESRLGNAAETAAWGAGG